MNDQTANAATPVADAAITCENSQDLEIQGRLIRLGRNSLAFEVHTIAVVLQMSEVLKNFKVIVGDRPIYIGNAVVTGLVHAGANLVCEASLDGTWNEVELAGLVEQPEQLRAGFSTLVESWSKFYRIAPEFKLAVADMQSFLHELRNWTEQIELGFAALPHNRQVETARAATMELVKPVTPCLNTLFGNFERVARDIPGEQRAAHGVYARRQLHSLVMASPFMHRIFRKPLGYPGDYEMVNMILRDPVEGGSLFGKVLNCWFLSQAPAEAHRNRIHRLTRQLTEATLAIRGRRPTLRVFNLGCGPAGEVAEFIRSTDLANHAEFTLLDFNEETIAYTGEVLDQVRQAAGRRTVIRFERKSVVQVLKSAKRVTEGGYDLVYCAGLFDYLPDRICQQLMNMFYTMLAPGGTLLATNVDVFNPIQHIMSHIFEWHLVYRDARQMAALAPTTAAPDDCKVSADITGSNIFLEVTKPLAAA